MTTQERNAPVVTITLPVSIKPKVTEKLPGGWNFEDGIIYWESRTLERIRRALTRAGFCVMRRYGIPKTDKDIENLRVAYRRILDRAQRIGWIES